MKNFQLIAVILTAFLFSNFKAVAQCDVNPIVDWVNVSDITLFFSSEGYCPDEMEDVAVGDSGEVVEADITSGNIANPDCDPDQATISFDDVWSGGCPETIERTWTVEYNTVNGGLGRELFTQIITLEDDEGPGIDCPPDVTLELSISCDETDPNVLAESGFLWSDVLVSVSQSEFEGVGGVVTEDCNDIVLAYYMDSDVSDPMEGNCPDEYLSFVRTWYLEDECGNLSDECEQNILIYDNQDPMILDCPGGGTPIEIILVNGDPCDDSNPEIEAQSGFPFDPGPVILTPAEFNAWGFATDNCNDGEIFEAQYEDEVIGVGCETGAFRSFDMLRNWTVTDLCGNTATCVQQIRLLDMEPPLFDLFPDYFYDQGPQGPDSGVWEIQSIFCNAQVDFTSEFTLPMGAEITDNCTAFGDLDIVYSPDIASGPLDIVEGENVIMILITDECLNIYEGEFVIFMECVGCGPDVIYEACTDPPTICELEEIEGFTSCTPEFTTGFGSLCSGFSLDNPSYFEFIAGAEDLDFVIEASNCSDGQGIQAMITDPCDATTCYSDNDGELINQDVPTGISASGLTVGNIYQLVVDGWGGDECNWTILSVSATPFAIPDPEPEEPIVELPIFSGCDFDELIFCEGTTIEFWPDTFEEATYFFCWSLDNLNGVSSSNGDEDCTDNTALATTGGSFSCSQEFSSCGPLELTFDEVGEFTLCLTELENGCDNEMPADYCWEVSIIQNGPIDFGSHNICQHDLDAGWYPDVEGPNGETWQGDVIFTEGMSSDLVSDDCGCMFEYQIEVSVLVEEPSIVEVVLCAYDLETFEDFALGLDWNDIEDYYDEPLGSNPVAYLNPLEEGSDQTGYDGIACDTFVYYDFFLYDVPGEIIQSPGPICDVILSLELDDYFFPFDLIDPQDLNYNWYDSNGLVSTDNSISVTEIGTYDLIIEFFHNDGFCSFVWEVDVSDFGSPPAAPTFVNSPNETCVTELNGILYSVPPAANATYVWSVDNGTFTANAGNDEITISITDPSIVTTVCVSADSDCGPSPENCEDIVVNPAPEIELLPVMDVCINQAITVSSNLTVGTANEYFWTIPGGNFTQTGSNMASSLVVSWATAGTYMVEVSVEDPGGCFSNIAMMEVNVLGPLNPPTASCSLTTSTSVQITITDNPDGQDGSTYTVTSGQTATEDNGVITVTGLVSGDDVTIMYTTLGGTHPCGDQSATITCTAVDCPLNPAIQQVQAICLDGNETPVQLVESAGNPGGEWSGPGTDASECLIQQMQDPGHIILPMK